MIARAIGSVADSTPSARPSWLARRDLRVEPVDRGLRLARARVRRADRLARERVDGAAVQQGREPAQLVGLLAVGAVARRDQEAQRVALAVALLHGVPAVEVDV